MKSILILCFSCFFGLATSAQDAPAPDYLTQQDFPDSVLQTPLINLAGKPVSFGDVLDQYQGQRMLIDFWASWCKDCLVSLPDYEKLQKKLKKQDITYLLLSVDKDDSKWKGAIQKFAISGEHFRFAEGWKSPLSAYVNLDWIPRYMILDENGKVIMPKSVKMSDPELYNQLSTK